MSDERALADWLKEQIKARADADRAYLLNSMKEQDEETLAARAEAKRLVEQQRAEREAERAAYDERVRIQRAAEQYFARVSAEMNRARIILVPGRVPGVAPVDPIDVTEDVVSILDDLIASMDWGSGFLDLSSTLSAARLAKLLAFDEVPEDEG